MSYQFLLLKFYNNYGLIILYNFGKTTAHKSYFQSLSQPYRTTDLKEFFQKYSIMRVTSSLIVDRSIPRVPSSLSMLLYVAPQTKHFDGCPALRAHVWGARLLKPRNVLADREREIDHLSAVPFSRASWHALVRMCRMHAYARGHRTLMTVFTTWLA